MFLSQNIYFYISLKPMHWFYYREHRSGLKVPTDVPPYKPDRGDRLIGYSAKQRRQMAHTGLAAGFDTGQIALMRQLWKIYDRGQIVNRLDVVCPGHGYKETSLKTSMLILWIQHEDITKNPEILRKIQSYPPKRLYRDSAKKRSPLKKRQRKRRWR